MTVHRHHKPKTAKELDLELWNKLGRNTNKSHYRFLYNQFLKVNDEEKSHIHRPQESTAHM